MALARLAALLVGAWCGPGAAARAAGAGAGARTVALSLRRHVAARAAPPQRPKYHWQPTDFTLRGCMSVPAVPLEPAVEERMRMTVSRCFAFCSMKRGMGFFAIAEGSKCWCGLVYEGTKTEAGNCSTACSGDGAPGCGGPMGASGTYADVYIMFDCAENTEEEEELLRQEKHNDTMGAYASFPRQTCGQALENKVDVAMGVDVLSNTHVGTVEECKNLCMHGRGSEFCHGFTYNEVIQKCTFHPDVLDGQVEKADGMECYFKKLGLLQAAPPGRAASNRTGVPRRCRARSPALSRRQGSSTLSVLPPAYLPEAGGGTSSPAPISTASRWRPPPRCPRRQLRSPRARGRAEGGGTDGDAGWWRAAPGQDNRAPR
ncbi:unnamed protein product [Prorocentrum cordatum]|uniref:WSC domain-containing protein n=1 Tax=Prorocentrum cordatum TaxID=2364126 RepID=A0ABN9TH82_9DINO|nr:unnamed protein product [Polarella glacialis]